MKRLCWTASQLFIFLSLSCAEPNISKGEASPNSASSDGNGNSTDSDSGIDDTIVDENQPCASGEPTMELGTGEYAFQEITDGDGIEVIHGTQDGHHILGSLRTQNTSEIVAIRFQIIPLSDGIAVSDQTYRVLLLPDDNGEPCAWTTIGMYAYLGRIDPGSAPFLDNPVLFQMNLVDDYGRELSQSLELIPYLTAVEHSTPPTEPTSKR